MWTLKKIRWAFSGRLIGSETMRNTVCETVLLLPQESIKYITNHVWFISSPDDAWAFTFRGSDISGQHLIILSEALFQENIAQIKYTILHELGHVFLRHKNSMGYRQGQKEIKFQEQQADLFAKRYASG